MLRTEQERKMPDDDTLTTKDLQWRYAVTPMTVYNWMQGSIRRSPLPHTKTPLASGKRNRITFAEAVVVAWAAEHGITPVRRGRSKPVNRGRSSERKQGAS
jgi:hypothetical protein